MEHGLSPEAEFIQQNLTLLSDIQLEIGRVVGASVNKVTVEIEKIPGEPLPGVTVIDDGHWPDDAEFEMLVTGKDMAKAEKHARLISKSIEMHARQTSITLWTLALMYRDVRIGPEVRAYENDVSLVAVNTPFNTGRLERVRISDRDAMVEIQQANIQGIPVINSIGMVAISRHDELAHEYLDIYSVDDELVSIAKRIIPVYDDVLTQAMVDYPEIFGKVALLMTGTVKDEDELMGELADIEAQYTGTEKASEVIGFIDKVKRRTLDAKSALEMERQFSTDLPTNDYLTEALQLIRSL